MRRMSFLAALAVFGAAAILGGTPTTSGGCTCFSVDREDALLVGRNYDWDFSDALVLVNPRGLKKRAGMDPAGDPRTWTARWGSVTFNQYGRDLPTGGINEKGLVVDALWLEETVYPPEDDRMPLETLQWIQYQLDTAETVDDVISSLARVRVHGSAPLHFYIADRDGRAAAIEFVEGKEVVHASGRSMPAPALTNDPYRESEAYLRTCSGWGGRDPVPGSARSLHRFARAATEARALRDSDRRAAPADIFRILQDVSSGERTQWSVVYDLKGMRVHFKTRASRGIKTFALAGIDFSCSLPARMIDIDVKGKGDLSGRWTAYTREANRSLIGRSYAKTDFLRGLPREVLDRLAAYPETALCER